MTFDPNQVVGQDFWARSVLSLIFPSMEAVRQVPQSTAEHQSTVTTGALCPPSESTLSRAGSPSVSWNEEVTNLEHKTTYSFWSSKGIIETQTKNTKHIYTLERAFQQGIYSVDESSAAGAGQDVLAFRVEGKQPTSRNLHLNNRTFTHSHINWSYIHFIQRDVN